MKYSTYMMMAAFAAGLVIVITIAVTALASGEAWKDTSLLIKGKQVTVTLPSFSHADITVYKTGGKYALSGFRGIEMVESDSISAPVMTMREGLKAITQAKVTGDTLVLNVDPAMLGDTTSRILMNLEVENIHPITITVPRGMLKSVDNRSEALYMTGFAAPRLDASMGSGRMVMNRCDIDSLVSDSRHINELKLTESTVKVVEMTDAPKNLSVNCTDMTSSVGKLKVKARNKCTLGLKKANVGELEWIPADSSAELDLHVVRPIVMTSTAE
ncbi:MAG: hypothetical protein NC421_11440 [Lachnospiraceae bacterium]|nr:hypothetical protein [Lachnospiraceae bacterium]